MAKGYFGRKKNVWTVAKNQIEKRSSIRLQRQKSKEKRI